MKRPRSVRLSSEEYLMLVSYFGSFSNAIRYLIDLLIRREL